MRIFSGWWKDRRELKRRIKALEEERRILVETLMSQPHVVQAGELVFIYSGEGVYKQYEYKRITRTPMG